MKVMSHNRVRKMIRRFRTAEELRIFCNKHSSFIRKRLPLGLMMAVKRKSNPHYTQRVDVLIDTVANA